MAICRTRRSTRISILLKCAGFGILFALLGFVAFVVLRSLCIQLGFRWWVLASMGGMMVLASAAVLSGMTLGTIVGMMLFCPERKISVAGSVAAFLCAGLGSFGFLQVMDLLGMVNSRYEKLSFLLAVLVVMPFSSVMGYDAVARMASK